MEAFIILLLLALIALPIGIVIALVRIHSRVGRLQDELDRLNLQLSLLQRSEPAHPPTPPAPVSPAVPRSSELAVAGNPMVTRSPSVKVSCELATPLPKLPPTPPQFTKAPLPALASSPTTTTAGPAQPPVLEPMPRPSPWTPVDWERFMGVKLIAWVGGLAMFLGVVFFVKHAFEQGLIPPEMRVALGFLAGLAMVVGGAWLHRRDYQMPAQTLSATGILILYGTTFACWSVYHFAWFGQVPTFLIMTLITAAALVLALKLEALVVAILGMVAGFLTPILLSSGQDNPLGLFSYVALLNAGLLALAFRRRWHFLALLAAVGTVLLQTVWQGEFFVSERYFEGNKILIAMAIFAGFALMFQGAWWWSWRREKDNPWLTAASLLLAAYALAVVLYWIHFATLGARPGLLFAYVLVVDLGLLWVAWRDRRMRLLEPMAGGAVFLLLALWMSRHLEPGQYYWGLGLVFGFALLHGTAPAIRQGLQPAERAPWWGHVFPLIALLLMLIPIFQLDAVPVGVWPVVLGLNLLVVGLAAAGATLVGLVGAVAITLLVASAWMLKAPPTLERLPVELLIIAVFAVFFMCAGILLVRRLEGMSGSGIRSAPGGFGPLEIPANWAPQIPALSAVMPFALLILLSERLPLTDPSGLFGVALLLVVLKLGMSWSLGLSWLPLVGLGSVLALQSSWHLQHFSPDHALRPLLWQIVFILTFTGFPFLFWRRRIGQTLPWAVAALAGPLHFYLVHRTVKMAWPMDFMGLLPVLFAVPSLAGLGFLIRQVPPNTEGRNAVLAWFGGSALFFVTLVFPIQFDRQWITLGWALEGAALLWLFRRIPHPGLRLTGFALLCVAFVRLALNSAVLEYHERSSLPILNWYLYTYGIVTACLFVGARWLAPPRHLIFGGNAQATLQVMGTVLAFLLLNIQIADYFTPAGALRLTFDFFGHFGRDMTYSIGWAAFALGLLILGIGKRITPARYAALVLLGVTLLKLFLHDLSRLSQLYRIGAFIGVAIIAMLASFLYQRFYAHQPGNHEVAPAESGPP